MEIERALAHLGLTENEAATYIALLRLGEARAGKIAETTDTNRSLIYRILESLQKKGLVSQVIKESRSYFSATSPRNLKKMLEEKEQELNEIMPALLSLRKKEEDSMQIEVYAGLQGIKTVLRDQLEDVKEFHVLGAGNEFASLTEHFYDHYYTIRIERRIMQKILFKADAKERMEKIAQSPYSEVRLLDANYKVPMAIVIYRDCVALISWPDKKAIVIRSRNVSEGFKEQFNILWKTAKR